MTIIHADLSGVLDASWPARRSGHVGRNPEPLEALERHAADQHVAYCEANAAYDEWERLDDELDERMLDARLAGWSLDRIARAARLSRTDPRIRALKDPAGADR